MKDYLLDTSVIMTYMFTSDSQKRSELKKVLKASNDLYILDFTKVELSNALRFSTSSDSESESYYQVFSAMTLSQITIDDALLKNARQLAFAIKQSVYDSLYHVAAIKYDLTFFTCDKKYFNAAQSVGNIELV